MAMAILNDWRNSLLLGVAQYVKFINKDYDEFAFNIITYTIK